MHTSILRMLIEWVTGRFFHKVEQKPVTPPPITEAPEHVRLSECPTLDDFEFWKKHVRQVDRYGNETPRFMDWYKGRLVH